MHSSAVRSKTFSTGPGGLLGAFRERFAAEEVDALLAECASALETYESGSGEVTLRGDDVVVKQFRYTRRGAGYDPDEVDDYLDTIVLALREHENAAASRAVVDPLDASPPLTAHAVRSMSFPLRGIGAVEKEAVDEFLVRCAEALDAIELGRTPRLTAAEVRAARFPRAVVELGYDSDEVDEFLGDVMTAIEWGERRLA